MESDDQKKSRRKKDEILGDIHQLVKSPGYIYCLFAINAHDLFLPVEEFEKVNWQERLSYQEINYLFGLLVKGEINLNIFPTQEQIIEYLSKTYTLLEELHFNYSQSSFNKLIERTIAQKERGEIPSGPDFSSPQESIIEMVFYDESGAYDFQHWDTAPKRYEKDKEWIMSNLGFSISEAVEVSKKIKCMAEKMHSERYTATNLEEYLKLSASMFIVKGSDVEKECPNATKVLSTFSVVPGVDNQDLQDIKDNNLLNVKPLIKVEEDKYIVPVSFFVSRSIDESPFTIMLGDKDYKQTAEKNRGDFTEDEIYDTLLPVFGREHVYKRVKILTPLGEGSKKHPVITDIDVLVLIGNKAIIVQAKSKKLTLLSRQGNVEKFIGDFDLGIQEAYNQGLISRKNILKKNAVFQDEQGNPIKIEDSINEAYIVIVSSDYYPGIGFQTTQLLNKNNADIFPLAINLYDIKLLAKYLSNPVEFLYYINQRTKYADRIVAQGEIMILGYHLTNRLYIDSKFTHIMVTADFGQIIDDDIIREIYGSKKQKGQSKIKRKQVNSKFKELTDRILSLNIPNYIDAIFYLMSLSEETSDKIIELIAETKNKAETTGKGQSFTMIIDTRCGISYIVQPNTNRDIDLQTSEFNKTRKYKAKALEWLTLGSYANGKEIVDSASYLYGSWVENKETEQLGNIVLSKKVNEKNTKIGRNDPCYCGSEKKYKKCHYLLD